MEAKWLEDFVSLAETHSFSRSAELRHVTQPAFSRRIQSLEAWLGVGLIDRSAYPTSLTPAGEVFYEQAVQILGTINQARVMLRGDRLNAQSVIEFAMPHTLSLTYMPKWLNYLYEDFGHFKARVIASNVHDAVMTLVDGGCDLLLCYHQPRQPVQLDMGRYEMLTLGVEMLRPYSAPDAKGSALYTFPGTPAHPLPLLSYSNNAYIGRMVEFILVDEKKKAFLETVYENDLAESLKMMVLAGHGVAFLPSSAVTNELKKGELVRADSIEEPWEIAMEVRVYREKPTIKRSGKSIVSYLWNYLASHPNELRQIL